jgi:hypothetical protein
MEKTPIQKLIEHINKDVAMKMSDEKTAKRLVWYIETYFMEYERQMAKDAFIAGRSFGIQLIRFADSEEPITKPDLTEYLTQLFGEGETGEK